MSMLLDDLLAETRRRLARAVPQSAAAVRAQDRALVGFSAAMLKDLVALKAFLFARMYRHPRVMAPMERAKAVVADLFAALSADPGLLPTDWAARCGAPGDAATDGVVRDYIAGMTDRFALLEYGRIFRTEIAL
jgi:dGTPase